MASNPCCCCCIFVKTGSILVGSLAIVLSVVKVSLISVTLVSNLNPKYRDDSAELYLNMSYVLSDFGGLVSAEAEKSAFNTYMIMGAELILNTMNIFFGALLIQGVRREILSAVRATLIFNICFFTFCLGARMIGLFFGIKLTFSKDGYELSTNLLRFYIIYVVYCAFVEIREGAIQGVTV